MPCFLDKHVSSSLEHKMASSAVSVEVPVAKQDTATSKRKAIKPVASGLKEDFTEFFKRFEEVENVRYERFAEIWRDMKFPLIWSGRQSEREAREFIEECMRIAVGFWLPPCNFQTQVGAMYLLYGFYSLQPCNPKVKIRLMFQEWLEIDKFYIRVKEEKHYDAQYIYLKLLRDKAFNHVGIPLDVNTRNMKDVYDLDDQPGERVSFYGMCDLINPVHLDTMVTFHEKYHKLKCQLAGENATRPDASLDFIQDDLIDTIQSMMSNHKQKIISRMATDEAAQNEADNSGSNEDPDSSPSSQDKIGKTRRKIKSKAFKSIHDLHESKKAKSKDEHVVQSGESSHARCWDFFHHDVELSSLPPAETHDFERDTMNAIHQLEVLEQEENKPSETQPNTPEKKKPKNVTEEKKKRERKRSSTTPKRKRKSATSANDILSPEGSSSKKQKLGVWSPTNSNETKVDEAIKTEVIQNKDENKQKEKRSEETSRSPTKSNDTNVNEVTKAKDRRNKKESKRKEKRSDETNIKLIKDTFKIQLVDKKKKGGKQKTGKKLGDRLGKSTGKKFNPTKKELQSQKTQPSEMNVASDNTGKKQTKQKTKLKRPNKQNKQLEIKAHSGRENAI